MIYWGNRKGEYSQQHRTTLPGQRSSGVAISDLNRDGIPEIILANRYRPLQRDEGDTRELDTDVDKEAISSTIYWGSGNGYEADRRTDLPTLAASAVAAGDLNGDGFADLVFANGPRRGGHSAPSPGFGSFIYWGGPKGYEIRRRTILPTMNTTDCLIDDARMWLTKAENRDTTKRKPIDNQYQPSKAELEADMSVPATPDELLQAVINSKPSKRG